MSQGEHPLGRVGDSAESPKCEVELPSAWTDFFDRHGLIPTVPGDKRRFPRSYLRASAVLECRQSLPAPPRSETRYKVCTKDVSRGGLSFLHSEQLFPSEQMSIVLGDGRSRNIEVVRCRRIQPKCFEIGAKFVASLRQREAAKQAAD